jgi:hypothetical protein
MKHKFMTLWLWAPDVGIGPDTVACMQIGGLQFVNCIYYGNRHNNARTAMLWRSKVPQMGAQ